MSVLIIIILFILQVHQLSIMVHAHLWNFVITKNPIQDYVSTSKILWRRVVKVYVRTVDTDVILIIADFFFKLLADYPGLDLWVGFGKGKYFQQIHVNTLCERLGEWKCTDWATIFSFLLVVTEPLSFIGKGKSQLGRLGNHIQVLLKYLSLLVGHPFQHLEDCSSTIQLLEHCFI